MVGTGNLSGFKKLLFYLPDQLECIEIISLQCNGTACGIRLLDGFYRKEKENKINESEEKNIITKCSYFNRFLKNLSVRKSKLTKNYYHQNGF